jgi:hypothetical protein
VKCYIDNSVHLRSYIRNVNIDWPKLESVGGFFLLSLFSISLFSLCSLS